MSKSDIIKNIFYSDAGYGSIKETLKDVKKIDPSIKYEDIRQWKENNIARRTNLRGYNSFIAHKPLEEFQMDLLFFTDLKDKLDKERISVWTDLVYDVVDVVESIGQRFYKVNGRDRLLMRHEILLIK